MKIIILVLVLLVLVASSCAAPINQPNDEYLSIYDSEELRELQDDLEEKLNEYMPVSNVVLLEYEGKKNISIYLPESSDMPYFGDYIKNSIDVCLDLDLNGMIDRLSLIRKNNKDKIDFIFSTSDLDGSGMLTDCRSADEKVYAIKTYNDIKEIFPAMLIE